jgi:uncharacterized protein Smg (DUF494 family)
MESRRDDLRNLLLYLLAALDQEAAGADGDALADLADQHGLESLDIAALLEWIESRWPVGDGVAFGLEPSCQQPGQGTVRLQAELEREVLTVPAFGYLMDLVRTGQISAEQMESLIQFAHQLASNPLAPGDLAPLLEHVVFARGRRGQAWRATEHGERPH